MERINIEVPKGIRYISEWEGFSLRNFPHILDKKIPGCGFTEWCLTNPFHTILCSPRKILLENKYDQHNGEVYLVRSLFSFDPGVDRNLNEKFFTSTSLGASPSEILNMEENKRKAAEEERERQERAKRDRARIKTEIEDYMTLMNLIGKPYKILVTYDSYRKVKEILEELGLIDQFYTIIDEFQSIFTDSRFKADVELEFVGAVQGIQKLCYVSATPMIADYLEQLDEFKNLPYYELDWEILDPDRISKPIVNVRSIRSIINSAKPLIMNYLNGKYPVKVINTPDGPVKVESKEACLYVNSIHDIKKIIRYCKLKPSQVNILCSKTSENEKKIGDLNKDKELIKVIGTERYEIGKVPLRGEPHKIITLCTRTVYLGADFYSTCASSYVFSDSTKETLSVDVILDVPQILGRQRLEENPWKNEITLYVSNLNKQGGETLTNEQLKVVLDKYVEDKLVMTNFLLDGFQTMNSDQRSAHIPKYESDIKVNNYKLDYVSLNTHSGSNRFPVLNKLIMLAEMRAFEIQMIDYKDRFSVFNRVNRVAKAVDIDPKISEILKTFHDKCKTVYQKMKFICELKGLTDKEMSVFLNQVHSTYRNLYYGVGPERCRSLGYDISKIKKVFDDAFNKNAKENINSIVQSSFVVGSKYSRTEIKKKLGEIYDDLGLNENPQASDLGKWFEMKAIKLKDQDGKWTHGFELTKKLN